MAAMWTTLCAVALLAAHIRLSDAHGYLLFPPSRNYQAFTIPPWNERYYCPHCGQGGGIGRQPGMCGDPFQSVVGDNSFQPFATRFYGATVLRAGSTINIQITVATNHGGRMSLAICPKARNQISPDCFQQPENRLRRVSTNPLYNNKLYWYLNENNMQSAEATFKLPEGVTCEGGCVLQWWWLGYQACAMPCEDDSVDVPGECGTNLLNPSVPFCDSELGTEQFFNCADVVITSGGNNVASPPPALPMSPPPPPSINPTPTPTSSPPPPGTPISSPPPPNTPAPTPMPGPDGACPADDWRCASCTTSAGTNSAAGGSIAGCYQCATNAREPAACAKCLESSKVPDIISGCLTCVTRGLPGWACNQQCAQVAQNSAQMTSCVDCLNTPGVNTWGCQNCLQLSGGDTAKVIRCTSCVKAGRDPWACGQCATKANPAVCYTCLSIAGANTGPCLNGDSA